MIILFQIKKNIEKEKIMYAIQLNASNGTINFIEVSSPEKAEEIFGNQVWMIVTKEELLTFSKTVQTYFAQNSQLSDNTEEHF